MSSARVSWLHAVVAVPVAAIAWVVVAGALRPRGSEHLEGHTAEQQIRRRPGDGADRRREVVGEAELHRERRVLVTAVEADEFVYRDLAHDGPLGSVVDVVTCVLDT